MVVLPATFQHCPKCDRLITVDNLNSLGRCTTDCGGAVKPPRLSTPLLVGLSKAHACPDPDNCAFGGEGCRPVNDETPRPSPPRGQ